MLNVFLCYSGPDREVALRIAARLERCAEARIWLETFDSGSTLMDAWEGGLSAGAILLILGPEAVPTRVTRQAWQPILDHITASASPPIASVLARPCGYPQLLERKNFFRWSEDLEFLRGFERWAIALHESTTAARSFAPAPLPWFRERPVDMDLLWRTLVDEGGGVCTLAGVDGVGKTALAQEFARKADGQFRDVVWVACGSSSDAFLMSDLGAQLGVSDPRSIPLLLREHRLLVIFDDVRRPIPFDLAEKRRSSILLTSRNEAVFAGRVVRMQDGFPIPETALEGESLQLWLGLSTCRPEAADVGLATRISRMRNGQTEAALNRLIEARIVDPLDACRVRVRRLAAVDDHLRVRHAEEVHASGLDCISELSSAVEFACRFDWDLARRLGQQAIDLLRAQHRMAEAVEVLQRLIGGAEQGGHVEAARHFRWELSWLQDGGPLQRPIPSGQQLQLSFAL